MRPETEVAGLLWDAVEFAQNARLAVGDTPLDEYLAGGPVAWATERQMELIGEALSKLRRIDPALAERVPNVHQIIAMRNVLIHGYLIVNGRVVWLAATQLIPGLIPILKALLAEVDPENSGSADE
ncbi:DUF86 domain-containing protein [Rathayibacter sp. KR2-224]|uniref:HepT-like ribonuclease domain-containing protein n=1 Tax=Rathayibacter sp. KR2-224 TaxID=3400913 RepID=UPI003C091733